MIILITLYLYIWSLRRCTKLKRTYQPKTKQRSREHGFRKRMRTRAGRQVIKNRRLKGRKRLTA